LTGPTGWSAPALLTSEPPGAPPCASRRAAYSTSPTGTAYRGACTLSTSPEIPCSGLPARTGTANASRASSTIPGRCAVPPVSTTPAGKRPPPYPARSNSRCTSWKISSTRWWMMCDSSSRDACRAPWLGGAVARPRHALAQGLRGGRLYHDEVHLDLEARPRHPQRIRDAALLVAHVLLPYVVRRHVGPAQRRGARPLVHPCDVLRRDLV